MTYPTFIASLSVLFLLISAGSAQQPNTPQATLTFQGVDGPPYPLSVVIDTLQDPTLALHVGGGPLMPFYMVVAPAGLASPGAALIWGFHDQDTSMGIIPVMDGLFGGTGSALDVLAVTDANGSRDLNFPMPTFLSGHVGAVQVLIADPVAPFGYRLTAATDLTFAPTVASVVYVSATTGSPGNPGTQSMPLASIMDGIVASLSAGILRHDAGARAGHQHNELDLGARLSGRGCDRSVRLLHRHAGGWLSGGPRVRPLPLRGEQRS